LIEYDMQRLFEHPLKFREPLPYAIVALGGQFVGQCAVDVQWRRSPNDSEQTDILLLHWDTTTLKSEFAEIEDEITVLRNRDEDIARRTEFAAVIVAVALMAHIEPGSLFTRRSRTGTSHDYYLNETRDEMIEIAGRWEGGLPGLFDQKRQQSTINPNLRKRWVSVTIFAKKPRNRTEGLLP
jgi:hypothetical protein